MMFPLRGFPSSEVNLDDAPRDNLTRVVDDEFNSTVAVQDDRITVHCEDLVEVQGVVLLAVLVNLYLPHVQRCSEERPLVMGLPLSLVVTLRKVAGWARDSLFPRLEFLRF